MALAVTPPGPNSWATARVSSGERSDETGARRSNRLPTIIVEHQDAVFATKKHATLSILCDRKYLAHLTIIVSRESSKRWVPELPIGSKEDARAKNENDNP